MATLYTRAGGYVCALKDPQLGAQPPAILRFDELRSPTGDGRISSVIITSFRIQPNPLFQVTDTLGDLITLLTFGESLVRLSLRGAIYEQLCNPNGGQPITGGIRQILGFYDRNAVTIRETPLTLIIGEQPVKAYCVAFVAELVDQEGGVWGFSLEMLAVPTTRTLAVAAQQQQQQNAPQVAANNPRFDPVPPRTGIVGANGDFTTPTGPAEVISSQSSFVYPTGARFLT